MNPPHIIERGANNTGNESGKLTENLITGEKMNAAITALKCALADAEANYRKIDNPAVSQQLSEGIRQYKKAIGVLSGCTFCRNIADNPIWFYDRAICPECAERIRTDNPFGMGK